ncbi:hypothetical protein C8R43DRAFT_1139214 [Mycena crocata]|nr:hypothetical protein C8R43DRAFT_1139214 [Mycena crocata]
MAGYTRLRRIGLLKRYHATQHFLGHMVEGTGRYKSIAANVAISLRGVDGVQHDVLCNYVSMYHTFPPLCQEFFWANAVRFATELQIQKRASRGKVGLLYLSFGRYVLYMQKQLGAKREAGVVLPNLGRFNAPTVQGNWNLTDIFFSQCDIVADAALTFNVMGDPTGALNILFTCGETSIDGVSVEEFVAKFQEELNSLLA